jgi:maltose O-acetyltransferase
MKELVYKIISKFYFGLEYLAYKYRYDYIYRKKYSLSSSFRFNGPQILMYGEGNIEIGDETYIGSFSSIQAYSGCSVKIGSHCSISHYFTVYTMNKNSANVIHGEEPALNSADVSIGDHCWIGHNVFIKEGVSIGSNVVIGSHSVVTKDIPDRCIAAGCPARIIHSAENEKK